MTGMEGRELCRQLRRGLLASTRPISLASLNQTSDKIEGMQVRADDYVTRPFAPRSSSLAWSLT